MEIPCSEKSAKSETRILDYVLLKCRFKKRKKSRFLDFQKNAKYVFLNYDAQCAGSCLFHLILLVAADMVTSQ